MTKLFEKGTLGIIDVNNRVFMAPLTRSRANLDGTQHEMAIKYYSQRASAGLIIVEATQISPQGQGYLKTPGIYNTQHAEAWKKVTNAVHANGGKIVLQLWHVGRISHTSLLPEGKPPVAPSAIQATADTFTAKGVENASEPRALDIDEIKPIMDEYVQAAKLAMDAGFDGVEVHGANGYLLNQFISTNTNVRDDQYGGSIENRSRLLLEVVDAVSNEVGHNKVGVRLSPTSRFNDIHDEQIEETYSYIYSELGKRNLAYLHVIERSPEYETPDKDKDEDIVRKLRNGFSGNYIANGDYDKASASKVLEEGAFAVAFGRLFISNPDLAERLEKDAELLEPNHNTFYGGDEKGYSDYPTLAST